MFRALRIRECTQEEKDSINQSLFRALPKIIGGQDGIVDPDSHMLLVSIQAYCPAGETELWKKWLSSKNSYRDVLWTWSLHYP